MRSFAPNALPAASAVVVRNVLRSICLRSTALLEFLSAAAWAWFVAADLGRDVHGLVDQDFALRYEDWIQFEAVGARVDRFLDADLLFERQTARQCINLLEQPAQPRACRLARSPHRITG